MHRNRILTKGSNNPYYIKAPMLKAPYACVFDEVLLKANYKELIVAQISGYRNARYYQQVLGLIEYVPEEIKTVVDFNIFTIEKISRELGFTGDFKRSSGLNLWWDEKPDRGTWGFKIAKALGGDAYVNSIGGASFISPEHSDGMRLGFVESVLSEYQQTSNSLSFIPGLSLIDIIANIGFEGLSNLTMDYKIKWKN